MSNGAERMRREMMIRVVRQFTDNVLEENIDKIPLEIRPKGGKPSRCCLYHDRAVLKYGLMALLGFDCGAETDEQKTLSSYLDEMKQSDAAPEVPLTVCTAGCNGCPDSRVMITSNCRGCFARPCMFSCPKNAISVDNQQAAIDYSKCIKCGKCMTVCPFNAILKTTVPCEDACPVGAIHKNEAGVAEIDFTKCIFCGKCYAHCPFGAIMERSQLLKVLYAIRSGRQVIALIAPSAQMQFPGTLGQLFSATVKAGFSDVMEVALGAERTTENEAKEFVERMLEGQPLMTTSCCSAYVEMVKKHLPAFLERVSNTPSPMVYAGQMAKEKYPDAFTVFVGPCIAKRYEATLKDNIDFALTFEELGAIISGMKIDIMSQEEWPIPRPAAATARNFAKSCGVTEAVLYELTNTQAFKEKDFKLDSEFINGIDKKTLAKLRLYAMGKLKNNFLEVMSCPGGCVGGPCSLIK